MSGNDPIIGEESAIFLGQVIDRAAASFNVAAMSAGEVLAVFILMERCTAALWREHREVLATVYEGMLSLEVSDDDDEPDGPGGNSN